MVYIYTLSDPFTNEIKYCGKTNNIKVRLSGHLKEKKSNKEKIQWVDDIKSRGLKPIIKIIDIVDDDNWCFWEKYWISQLKTWGFELFNKTDGGEYSVTGFRHSEETKKKISELQNGRILNKKWCENISLGRKGIIFSDEHLKNLSFSHIGQVSSNKKEIYQIDVNNGDILNKFESITDAYIYLNLEPKNSSLISTACKGKIKSAYGYYWCYVNNYYNFEYKEYNRIYNPILQYNKIGKLVNEYSNIKIAAKENKLKQSSISHALNETPSCGGYIWFRKGDFDNEILIDKLKRIKKDYKLYQLDVVTGDILNEFISIKEAEKVTKIKHISLVLSGDRKSAGGFKWIKKYINN